MQKKSSDKAERRDKTYGALEAFPDFLERFTPPAGEFDPRGAWKQTYAMRLFAEESGTIGYLEIERRPAADGVALTVATRFAHSNGYQEETAKLSCGADRLGSLRSIEIESVLGGQDNAPVAATRMAASGVVRGASIEWTRGGRKRTVPAPPPLVASWSLLEAVGRMKPGRETRRIHPARQRRPGQARAAASLRGQDRGQGGRRRCARARLLGADRLRRVAGALLGGRATPAAVRRGRAESVSVRSGCPQDRRRPDPREEEIMKRRDFIGAALAAPSLAIRTARGAAERPNFLFLMADQLSMDAIRRARQPFRAHAQPRPPGPHRRLLPGILLHLPAVLARRAAACSPAACLRKPA